MLQPDKGSLNICSFIDNYEQQYKDIYLHVPETQRRDKQWKTNSTNGLNGGFEVSRYTVERSYKDVEENVCFYGQKVPNFRFYFEKSEFYRVIHQQSSVFPLIYHWIMFRSLFLFLQKNFVLSSWRLYGWDEVLCFYF